MSVGVTFPSPVCVVVPKAEVVAATPDISTLIGVPPNAAKGD